MIVASIFATIGALIIGVPIGLFTAIFLAEIAPKSLAKIISPAVQLLAGYSFCIIWSLWTCNYCSFFTK